MKSSWQLFPFSLGLLPEYVMDLPKSILKYTGLIASLFTQTLFTQKLFTQKYLHKLYTVGERVCTHSKGTKDYGLSCIGR